MDGCALSIQPSPERPEHRLMYIRPVCRSHYRSRYWGYYSMVNFCNWPHLFCDQSTTNSGGGCVTSSIPALDGERTLNLTETVLERIIRFRFSCGGLFLFPFSFFGEACFLFPFSFLRHSKCLLSVNRFITTTFNLLSGKLSGKKLFSVLVGDVRYAIQVQSLKFITVAILTF